MYVQLKQQKCVELQEGRITLTDKGVIYVGLCTTLTKKGIGVLLQSLHEEYLAIRLRKKLRRMLSLIANNNGLGRLLGVLDGKCMYRESPRPGDTSDTWHCKITRQRCYHSYDCHRGPLTAVRMNNSLNW